MGFCRSQAVVTVYRCRDSATLSESKSAGINGKGVSQLFLRNQSSSMETSPWSTVEGGVGSVTGANGSVFSGNVSTSEVSVTGEPLSLVLWLTEVGGGASSPNRWRILSPIAFICASIARRPILSSWTRWPDAMLSALAFAIRARTLSSAVNCTKLVTYNQDGQTRVQVCAVRLLRRYLLKEQL